MHNLCHAKPEADTDKLLAASEKNLQLANSSSNRDVLNFLPEEEKLQVEEDPDHSTPSTAHPPPTVVILMYSLDSAIYCTLAKRTLRK